MILGMWNRIRTFCRSPFSYGLAGSIFYWASLPH